MWGRGELAVREVLCDCVNSINSPGLFPQREGPGSEPGNSLLCPDEAACSEFGVLGMVQCRASLMHEQHKQWLWGLGVGWWGAGELTS